LSGVGRLELDRIREGSGDDFSFLDFGWRQTALRATAVFRTAEEFFEGARRAYLPAAQIECLARDVRLSGRLPIP